MHDIVILWRLQFEAGESINQRIDKRCQRIAFKTEFSTGIGFTNLITYIYI